MSNQENVFETILAPMTGTAVAITEVPDPIFIEKILGDGIAIVPTEGKVVSPVDGTVSKVAETGHIYAVTSDNGVEVVIHVGLETVALNGKCFQIHVKEGQFTQFGDLRLDEDRCLAGIQSAGHVVQRHFNNILAHLLGILDIVRQCLCICDHDKSFLIFTGILQLYTSSQRAYIMSHM